MPTLRANNYETHYEADDFTDPWKPAETVWIQHGFGRSARFWYHWVPALARRSRLCAAICAGTASPPIRARIAYGRSTIS